MKTLKIIFSAFVLVLLAACAHQSADTLQDAATPDASPPATEEGDTPEEVEAKVDYTLNLGNYYYEPNVIEAKAGSTIRIKLVNVEGTHDFDLDELGVESSRLRAGEEEIIEFEIPADSAGETYEFYCSIGSHRALGMVGSFVVTE